ncbi:hypothetical protein F4777DRAFT_102828 [Nemania sp. FL0916]|nr:hypothetical protein F4777DRAFT_102828 [Nemania sp. FL0916]
MKLRPHKGHSTSLTSLRGLSTKPSSEPTFGISPRTMAWQQVSDTKWERPVSNVEGYLIFSSSMSANLYDGHENFTFFSKIQLETQNLDLIPALKHAWKQIRYEQPQITATVESMKKVYEVPDTNALEEWLASTFIVSSASDADDLYSTAKPIHHATLYYLPTSSEIVFRCPHHTIDATGVLLFWHSYLQALEVPRAGLRFGNEPASLAPSMEQILNHSGNTVERFHTKGTELFTKWADCIPGVAPGIQLETAPSGRCQITEMVFPVDTTRALVAACKITGVTVTAAVHAAYARAAIKYSDSEPQRSQYVASTQFDIRRYLPEPYDSNRYAVSNYVDTLPYMVDLPASFWDIAKSLHKHYQTSIKGNAEVLDANGHMTRILGDVTLAPEFLAKLSTKDAVVSSLGIVERHVQREYGSNIKVKDLKIGLDIVMGSSMLLIYTFHDQLRLEYSFNDGLESAEDVQTYLEEVRSILTQELLA